MLILHTPVPVCGDKWLITHFLYVPEHTGFSLGCYWGGGGVIEGLIGTQEIYLQERKPKHKHVSLTILMRTELVTP